MGPRKQKQDDGLDPVPPEYHGREQTLLKHRYLSDYLNGFAQKVASLTNRGIPVRFWYVDCFAGPWNARSKEWVDSSPYIGLKALKAAAERWKNPLIQLGAIFVEKDPGAYSELLRLIDSFKWMPHLGIQAYNGEFGEHVDTIRRELADDWAFLFVDPFGWKGAAMRYIKPLMGKGKRDVLINVMYYQLGPSTRKDNQPIREQIRDFFGLADVPAGTEEELMELYRNQLRSQCNLEYVADCTIQDKLKDTTKMRLVVGGHHAEVIRHFRTIEQRIIGKEALAIRKSARLREDEDRSPQILMPGTFRQKESEYEARWRKDCTLARAAILRQVEQKGPQTHRQLWGELLQFYHITEKDLAALIKELGQEERLEYEVSGSIEDSTIVRVKTAK